MNLFDKLKVNQPLPQAKGLAKKSLGKKGEDLACAYLQKNGYRILERNFQKHYGELDIVCLDGNTLVFVEVKTRVGSAFGKPEEAITPWKLREVVKTAQFYKMLHPKLPDSLRVDVIWIEFDFNYTLKYFNHLKNVTL